jgi:hypothetical protein
VTGCGKDLFALASVGGHVELSGKTTHGKSIACGAQGLSNELVSGIPQKHWNKTLSQIPKLLKTNGELVAIPRDS